MTPKSPTNDHGVSPGNPSSEPKADGESEATGFVSYLSGHWRPHHQLAISVEDVGFRQGITAVERLRTYGGRIFATEAHLDRWSQSTSVLGIRGLPSRSETRSLLDQLLTKNEWNGDKLDVGITMFATPGLVGENKATFGLHLNRLNHQAIEQHRRHGQPLVVSDVRQPDSQCWPRTIKVRARIHYFQADRMAKEQQTDAIGVLLDTDDMITETSVANIAIVNRGEVVSPPADRVLGGITQSVVEEVAKDAGIAWWKRPISIHQFAQAEEILLMGTDGGLWFGNSVNGKPVSGGSPGVVYEKLRERFDHRARHGHGRDVTVDR